MKSLLFAFLLVISLSLSVHHEAAKKKLLGQWTLTKVDGVALGQPTKVTFDADKIFLKYCNNINFPYAIKGSNIDVQPGISTRMACTGMNPPENKVSDAFTNAKRYQISSKLLTLYGNKDQVLARLKK